MSSFKAFFVFKNPKIFWFQKILNQKLLVFETLKKKKEKKLLKPNISRRLWNLEITPPKI